MDGGLRQEAGFA